MLNKLLLLGTLFVFSFAKAQVNNFILVYEDNYNAGVQVSYVNTTLLKPYFDYPLGVVNGFPNIPEGAKALVLDMKPNVTGILIDKTDNVCAGAAYYYKFFIGNEWTTSDLPGNGPIIKVEILDATNLVLWTATYNNIQYAFNEITTSTFIPNTSTIKFQVSNTKLNPSSGSAPDGIYKNDAVFDDLRLYQNNPTFNYQVTSGTPGVTICTSDSPENLSNYLYWPMNSGTWAGPSTLPNPNGTFNPLTNTAGLYTFTNNNTGVCPDTTSTINVIVTPGPSITSIADVQQCGGQYTLPAITGSNIPASASYYSGSLGTGTAHAPGSAISSSTTLYAYATNGSCSDQDTIAITIQTPPNAGTDISTQFCSSSSATDLDNLIGTANAGTWTETSTTSSGNFNTTTAVLDVPNTSTGTFTFQHLVLGTGACPNDTAFVSIVINDPSINAYSNQTVCESYTLPNITGTNLSGNQAYYTGINGTGTSFNPGANITSSQTLYAYDVSPSDATCFTQQSFSITVNQQLSAGTDFSSAYCASTGALNLNTLITGEDAGGTWTNTSGVSTTFNATTGAINVSTEANGTYVFQYVVNSTAPCLNDTSKATIQVINPAINAISNATACEGYTLPIITGSSLSGNESYYTGINGTGTNYNVGDIVSTSGTLYAYDVSPSDASCFAQQSFVVTINQQATAGNDFTSSYCTSAGILDLNTLITGEDAGGTWTNTSGNATTFNATTGQLTTGTASEGTYDFQYVVSSTSPCVNDTSFAHITILEVPIVNMTSSANTGCLPATFSFASGTNSNPNYTYNWTFSNGTSSTLENPTNTFSTVGCYDVSLNVTNTGGLCPVNIFQAGMVCVIASPVASFTTDQDTLTPTSNVLTGTNNSTGADSYLWDFGDFTTDTAFALNHTYASSESGYYTVILTVTNTAGCTDTASKQIYILNQIEIILPNVFTPNGDMSNDIFTVNIQGVKHLEWNIFNRWGNLMTSGSQDTDASQQHFPLWNGGDAVEGVYFITLRYKDLLGEENVLQGHLNLVRQ